MSASKQKGTAFETLVLAEFARHYPGAERRALQGALDKGDLLLPGEDRYIAECKRVTRMSLAQWVGEAQTEAANAGVPCGVVIHKRVGKGQPGDQYVTTTLREFLHIATNQRGTA